jgi:protein-disulfide isomerase
MTEKSGNQLFPAVVILLLVVMAFLLGTLYQKVQLLEKGGTTQVANAGTNNNNAQPSNPSQIAEAAGVVDPVSAKDHVRGDRNARIALIEYSDLECPYCQQFHGTAQQILDSYKGKVMWVYRHFPLSFHPTAMPRAIGSECVAKLGGEDKFWAYVDKMFSTQGFTGTPDEVATGLGIDKAKFDDCIKDAAIKAIIDADEASGTKAGVTGTPGNILLDTKTGDKQLIPGAVPFEQIKPVIDQMLAK